MSAPVTARNPYTVRADGVVEIHLLDRAGRVRATATVDEADFELVAPYRWRLNESPRGNVYALARRYLGNRKEKPVYLHRLVAGEAAPEVDHADGNGLNNQRSNLRVASRSENMQNLRRQRKGKVSPFRGVTRDPRGPGWRARGALNGRETFIGYYQTEQEAGAAAAVWRAEHMPFSPDADIRRYVGAPAPRRAP
jgi:hypothetical protein